MSWRPLPWDSGFFGISIGRIDLTGATPASIAAAEADARAHEVRCVYAEVPAADATLVDLAQRSGYRIVDVAMDLTHATSTLPDPAPTSARARVATTADVASLDEQIEAVAPWSRFATDLRFGPDAALALHRRWVERAAAREDGRLLLVAEDRTGIVGLSTIALRSEDDHPGPPPGRHRRIDLIATTRPGSGAAHALVQQAFELFGPGPSVGGPIAARNVASLRFSEHLGYRVRGASYHLHRWLDEPRPPGPSSPLPTPTNREGSPA